MLGEASSREPEGMVHPVAAQAGGEFDGVGHLGADPGCPDGCGFLEPAPGTGGAVPTNASSASERCRSLGWWTERRAVIENLSLTTRHQALALV
ncbi:hypothetical protein [Kitasatospora brasiliensis]|uniref:hypothetical protein n=1 Tax=Kitasatospora brasiliensis TaxID=3058040 RepID=UPI0029302D68|nr:hypothetical protein [Kitasatospora sp. K002]